MLPASIQSFDRFVRGSWFLQRAPITGEERQCLAAVLSMIRNQSEPWGSPDPEHPSISPTRGRSLSDQARRLDDIESAL